MNREELKGKQTPGVWKPFRSHEDFSGSCVFIEDQEDQEYWDKKPFVAIKSDVHENVVSPHDCFEFKEADAALIAESGTVANRTGMWPEDMEKRIKELESILKMVVDSGPIANEDPNTHGMAEQAILNKGQ